MKKTFLLLLLSLTLITLFSQNLILNADFEESNNSTYKGLKYWSKCIVTDSPDYFTDSTTNKVFDKYIGGMKSYSGNSHVGIFVYRNKRKKKNNTREYIQVPLVEALEKDKFYYAEAFIAADAESNILCSSIGIYFSSQNLDFKKTSEMFNLRPQVENSSNNFINKNKWTILSGTFKAKGDEKFLIVGNFKSDDNTRIKTEKHKLHDSKREKWNITRNENVAYYYIDKLKLILKEPVEEIVILDSVPTIFEIDSAKLIASTKILEEIVIETTHEIVKTIDIDTNSIDLTVKTPIYFDEVENFLANGEAIILNNINFEYNKSEFKDSAIIELNKLLRLMRQNPTMEIEINGHTDNIGTIENNIDLSLRRAKAVQSFLINNLIDKKRIQTYGYGNAKPIDDNNTKEGRKKNRRVEFIILKI